VIHVGFKGQVRPVVSARSNYTWCVTRPAQAVAERLVENVQGLATNGQMLSVNSQLEKGPLLMLVGPQTHPSAGIMLQYYPWLEGELCWCFGCPCPLEYCRCCLVEMQLHGATVLAKGTDHPSYLDHHLTIALLRAR
jgi:hypothetical protein